MVFLRNGDVTLIQEVSNFDKDGYNKKGYNEDGYNRKWV